MKLIRKLIKFILLLFPKRNIILFESVPTLSDNPKAVFDEMLRRNMNEKYKFVWLLFKDTDRPAKIKNVKYLSPKRTYLLQYYRTVSKCIICGNRFIEPASKDQPSFYLPHGTALKTTAGYYRVPESIQYVLLASSQTEKIMTEALAISSSETFPLGYPRNDILTNTKADVKKLFNTSCDKVIVWYPTFRQHAQGGYWGSGNALPIIHDADKAKMLNDWACENSVLIVLKPHFAQNLSYVKDLGLENIVFIDDDFFTRNNLSSYEFVGACDALISDYSSIYYDFTLCNKPIGLVWEDIEEYKQNPGLIEEYEYFAKGGVKIYDIDDMKKFVSDVANGIDTLYDERNEIKLVTNYSEDGKNSERVVDFITKKAGLRSTVKPDLKEN